MNYIRTSRCRYNKTTPGGGKECLVVGALRVLNQRVRDRRAAVVLLLELLHVLLRDDLAPVGLGVSEWATG